MVGLDTNVLVRYLAQDDPVQSALATRLIEQQLGDAEPGFIGLVVLDARSVCPIRRGKTSGGTLVDPDRLPRRIWNCVLAHRIRESRRARAEATRTDVGYKKQLRGAFVRKMRQFT